MSVGFEVSLGPCLEARVFGKWEGEGGEAKHWEVGGGPVGAFITESSAVEPPVGTEREPQVVSRE